MRFKSVEKKSFAMILLCIIILCAGFLLSACGDKYAGLGIEVDKTEISLKIGGEGSSGGEGEQVAPESTTLRATLVGASAEMSRGMSFRFDDTSIVTPQLVDTSGDINVIRLTATTAGTTKMYIVSNEKGTVVSDPITVTVYRDADTMEFDNTQKPSVKLGSSMSLETNDLIKFAVAGEPVKIHPSVAEFKLLDPADPRWNSKYGTTLPTGVTIQDGVLSAAEDASVGIVQVLATRGELSTVCYIMVYAEIDAERMILLYQNNTLVEDTVKSIINPIEYNGNQMQLVPQISDVRQNYKLRVTSRDADILLVGSPNAEGTINAVVCNSGKTKLAVMADLIDPITGVVYKTFEKTYDVDIGRIVTAIKVYSDDVSPTADPAKMTVQDYYVEGVEGKKVHYNVYPDNDENSSAIADTNIKLAITQVDGMDGDFTANGFDDVVVKVDGKKYVWGETIPNDKDIYVSLGMTASISKSFRLTLLANTLDPDLPKVSNYIDFTVAVGVKEISLDKDEMLLGVGLSDDFRLTYKDRNGNPMTGSPRFIFNKSDIFSVADKGNYDYSVTGNMEGDTTIVITAESGARAEIDLRVRTILKSLGIITLSTEGVLATTMATANPTAIVGNIGLSDITVAVGSEVVLGYKLNPVGVGSSSFGVESVVATDTNNEFLSVGSNFVNGKLLISGLNATGSDAVVVTISYNHYIEMNGSAQEVAGSISINVKVYKPLSYMYWQDTANLQSMTKNVLNINKLNYLDRSKGTTTLAVRYDSTASYFVNGGKIAWSVDDSTKVTLAETENVGELLVTGNLAETDMASVYRVNITAYVEEFSVPYVLNCILTIENPVKVEGINLLNYYDSFYGVRLNDIGATDRTQFEIVPEVVPGKAYNKKLRYVILTQDKSSVVESEDAIITLDEQNPNIISAVEGKSGRCYLRLFPEDALLTSTMTYQDVGIYVDILVVVEDGEENPYTIYEPAEFMAIGNSQLTMTKNYILMNSIDVSAFDDDKFPLGGSTAFTGTIKTKKDTRTGLYGQYSVSGLPVVNNAVSADGKTYLGVFSQIDSDDSEGAICNIDFYFDNGSIDFGNSNANGTVYAGLLAGRIAGNLNNVFVNYTNYRTNDIVVSGLSEDVIQFYFGAVAGEFVNGKASDVCTNVSLNLDRVPTETRLIVGGMFGQFAGLSLGQAESLLCNVKITATYADDADERILAKINNNQVQAISEGIGGLIGIAIPATIYTTSATGATTSQTKIGVVYSMQVMGNISAEGSVNVGGLVGKNEITFGKDEAANGKTTLYKNLASVRVRGGANVGGFVGANDGKIYYGTAEIYDNVKSTDYDDIIWVKGLYRVGGFAGFSGETSAIGYSFAMSYINRNMQAFGTATSNASSFYGDIIGGSQVGGFAGFVSGAIHNSFAYTQIQQVNISASTASTLDKYTGGFAGVIVSGDSASTRTINYTFAIGNILSSNPGDTAQCGEYVGYYSSGFNAIYQVYACVYITTQSGAVYNFAAAKTAGATTSESFFMNDGTEAMTGGYSYSQMKLNSGESIYNKEGVANWGFTKLANMTKQQWVAWDNSISGVNKDLPILYDKNGKMLYNQIVNSISVVAKDSPDTSANLPTYFAYRDNGGSVLGSVVLLDNITPNIQGMRSISLSSLFDISVEPANLDPADWKISIESSDYRIVEVVQPRQNLIGAYLVFKDCGVVTIKLTSLLNINVIAEIELNVVGGFNEFSIKDSQGRLMTDSDYIMYVKVGRDMGYSVHAQFDQRINEEYITPKGLVYTTESTDYIRFDGMSFDGYSVYIGDKEATIISGVKPKAELVEMSVSPYIELTFGGDTYKNVFTSLQKGFKIKVYQGISSVDVYTGIEANMPSGSEVLLGVDVVTDNSATVELNDIDLAIRGNITSGATEMSKFMTLVEIKQGKIATKNAFSCYLNGERILDRRQIADIVLALKNGTSIDAYIKIGDTEYRTVEEITSIEDYVITDCVRYTFVLSLKGADRQITQNVVFCPTYTICDTESGDRYVVSDEVTFVPASITKMELKHFTYGATSMEAGEAAGNSISPGTSGVLRIDVTPYYAYFDYLIINASALSGTGAMMLQQMVYKNGIYRYMSTSADYDSADNLILRKVTGIDADGQEYFDGRIFVSTLITAGTQEGSQYSLTVAPKRNGENNPVFEPQTIMLTTTFAPFATLRLDADYGSNIVARGSLVNLRLKGTLLNSTLDIASSYYGTEGRSRLTNCAFYDKDIKYSFTTGEREEVDMLIPFYIGLLAEPDNGKIIISVTINSYTSLGGRLNPLVVTCVLNVVDYIVDETYTRGTQTGNLEISVNSYTPMIALFVVNEPKLDEFEQYIGYSTDSVGADAERTEFAEKLAELQASQQEKIKYVNALGAGNGGVWWFNDGTGFAQINTIRHYPDFLVVFDETAGQDCYKLRGRDLKTDFALRLSFETTYIYNESKCCYEFVLKDEITSENSDLMLEDYLRKLEHDFLADLTEQSDEDNPYAIDSAEAFRTSMVAGGNYMLTADIELFEWTPIDTAIASLDGNGHIIYLRSFARSTNTESTNIGLFGTLSEGSVLKNLIVDVSHNLYINLKGIQKVRFGYIAGVNNGIIYNCDVVVTKDKAAWKDIYNNTARIDTDNADEQFGRNIFDKIINNSEEYHGYNTLASTFVMTSKTIGSVAVSSVVGGLVGENTSKGSITNCRVGRVDSENPLGTTTLTSPDGAVYARQGLNLFASGDVGGLVGSNSGVISNSYFANAYVVNSLMDIYTASNTSGARTAGLVAVQTATGRIFGSYARGQLDADNIRSRLGGVIAYGTVGGLVHSNSGAITDCYSNLNLSSASGMGGFVYENLTGARILQSYSLSTVKTQGLINGMFVGIDNEGNLLDNPNALVENCFYLTEEGIIVDSAERAIPLAKESWQDPTGSLFEGFSVSIDDDGESTWYIDSARTYLGPQLYLADKVFVSSRTTIGENADYIRGSAINPLLITSKDSWTNKIFNYRDSTHKSSYLKELDIHSTKEPLYEYADAYIMLLTDIDFGGAIDTITSKMRFSGHLYGNGHSIGGISFTQSVLDLTAPNDFGLFAELSKATVSNLALEVEQELNSRASHVGVLAGSISDSLVENIVITGEINSAKIIGTNMVGALAGYVTGDSRINNIKANLSILATSATIKNQPYTYYSDSMRYSANVSYAGGIIGVLDLDKTEDSDNTASPRVRNLLMKNAMYMGTTLRNVNIDIAGEVVGGVVGLVGTNSEIYKVYFEIKSDADSAHIRGRNFTGGLVGENRGALLNARLGLPIDEQVESDGRILSTDSPSSYIGTQTVFASESNSNAVGGLVGLSVGGMIKYSYNRVAVINTKARVAGGIIGLAINAPKTFDTGTTVDPVIKYLRAINTDKNILLSPVAGGINYSFTASEIVPESGKLTASAMLQEVYTTAMVNSGEVIGGLVGAQLNAPIYTYTASSTPVVGANAYDEKDAKFVAKIQDETQIKYIGSATGYLGYNYSSTPSSSQIIAYVSNLTVGTASQNLKVTTKVKDVSIDPVGNISSALNDVISPTSFISAATSSEDKPFANFDTEIWNLDNDKLEHRFPYHKIGYDSPVKDINTVDEFFEELVKTRSTSHYRIVKDLVITGARWQQFYEETGLYSLGSDTLAVRGRLEGAVSIIADGKYTTRPANITFTAFEDTHMHYYHSLFGYTNSFKMSNLNFIYEFDFDASAVSGVLNEFGLLMLSTNATSLNNIGVYMHKKIDEENEDKFSLTLDSHGTECRIQNFALVTARSYNSVFNNVYFDANISAKDMTLPTPEFCMGAIAGTATGTLAIGGVDQGRVGVEYASNANYQVSVGGLVGKATGVVTLAGVVNKTGNIRGSVKVTCGGEQPSHIGGVIGLCNNTLNLKNFASNVDIILDRNNTDSSKASIDYVGGITGEISHSNISGACVLGDINIVGGNGTLYVGGIAGMYTNPHTFATQHTGYLTQNSSCYGDINITSTREDGSTRDFSHIYVGGIYGLTTEQITMTSGDTEPMGESVNVYSGLYSNADIRLNVNASFVYAGGIFGKSTQGIMTVDPTDETQYVYNQFTKPNVVLRIASSGFVGDLIVDNAMMDGGVNYLGGIVGESELLMQDLYSNGAILFATQGAQPAYVGGIVGYAENHIFGAVSLSVLNQSRAYSATQNTFIDAIGTVATTLISEDNKVKILVDKVYCSPQLNGIYNQYGTAMTATEAFEEVTAQLIVANLNNWTYRKVECTVGEDKIIQAIVVPQAIASIVDYSIGGEIVPLSISEYSELLDAMAEDTYPHTTVFLAQDVVVDNTQINKDYKAVRRIVGNSNSFVIDNYAAGFVSGNFGLFKSIPNNALISTLGIKFDSIALITNGDAKIGALAGSNYGTIFNVSIGALPAIDTDYMGTISAQGKTVATFSSGVNDRYLGSVINSHEIATLVVMIGSGNSQIGGMFGYNAGTITNSIVSMDISVAYDEGASGSYLSTGGVVGKLECGILDNVMTNGRLDLAVDSEVGGLAGTATDSIVLGAISNINLGIFVPDDTLTHAGFAFGSFSGGVYKGVIVNTNISATDTDYFGSNTLYSKGYTTEQMSSTAVMDYIAPKTEEGVPIPTDNGFKQQIWSQDDAIYYGYPVLNTITNIDFGTGDGTTDNPYQFAETAQLLDLVNAKGEISYCLTRDMVISPQNYAEISKILLQVTEINGMGHTIVIYDLPDTLYGSAEGEADIGLFREIKYGTLVRNLGIAIADSITIDTPLKVNFGGLAVRNYGNIANCYVVSNDAEDKYHSGTIRFTRSLANSYVGGLVSQNYGEISNSWCDVNFVGCEGHFGGVIGLQAPYQTVDPEGNVTNVKQSSITSSFGSGSIYLSTVATAGSTGTSAGGLVGKNTSYLTNGYVVRDCYVYGAKLGASVAGLNIGALIGYSESRDSNNRKVLNTYRTYAYVATDTVPAGYENRPSGNYLGLGMVGNQQSIVHKDTSSSFAVAYYVQGQTTHYQNEDLYRTNTLDSDVANLTVPGSAVTIGLRSYSIGQNIYQGWGNNSLWARNSFGASYSGTMLYLRGVTPVDRQEYGDAIVADETIFEVI